MFNISKKATQVAINTTKIDTQELAVEALEVLATGIIEEPIE